jgi:NitT/TauT family transport system substrate-binding protein
MPNRLVLALVALLAPAIAFAQTKLVVAHSPASEFLPAFVAKERGIFARNGLDVTFNMTPNITLIPAALVSGTVQIGSATATNALLAAEAGIDIVTVMGGTRLVKSNQRIALVTRPGLTVANANDLRGKRVGVPGFNAVIDLVFQKWLLNNKVPLNQVTRVEVLVPQMADFLKAGQVDAATPIEPMVGRIVEGGLGVKSVDFWAEVNPDVIAAFWIASRQWADANRNTVAAWRSSYLEGIDWIAKNPDEARKIEIQYLKVSARSFPTFDLRVEQRDLDFFQAIAIELGVQRKPVDTSRLVWK